MPARGVCALVRPGQRLEVVDVSTNGALVEGGRPLRPGSEIEVQLESDVRGGMIAAHVMRCSVAALHGESGITYRAALAFHEACDWVREILTLQGYRLHCGHSANATARDERGAHLPAMGRFAETTEER